MQAPADASEVFQPATEMNEAQQTNVDSAPDESEVAFCAVLVQSLGAKVRLRGGDLWADDIPESVRDVFGGAEHLHVPLVGSMSATPASAATGLAPTSPLFHGMCKRLRDTGTTVQAMPAKQPSNVHEIANRILGHFRFPAGQLHLAGCTLDLRPILCLVYVRNDRLALEFFWPNGQALESATITALELHTLRSCDARVPRTLQADVDRWFANVHQAPIDDHSTGDPVVRCIVWCNYAEGKIAFESDEQTVEVSFAGWAKEFMDGARPQPFRCEITGKESYHLDVTDDGQITVAESIAVCAASGRRVLEADLRTCSVSGRRLLAEYVETCPITGEIVSVEKLVKCDTCLQQASPHAVRGGKCNACRRLNSVQKEDARMARVLGEYPGLDRWRRWRMSETSSVYVLVGSNIWQRVLLVLNQNDLQPQHIAQASRLSGWSPVAPADYDRFLR